MDKKTLTEQDIRTKFITPAIESAGWDKMTQMKEELYFTDGRIDVRGQQANRQEGKKADYILYYNDIPLIVIEAKDNNHSISHGIQQALDYAEILDIPFAFSSNGDGFLFHNKLTGEEKELSMKQFPSPDVLWTQYKDQQSIDAQMEPLISEPYHRGTDNKEPRYYQRIAINRTIEAIAKGQNRLLLVMATGTGKTYTAFQIMHKLKKTNKANRILFLADRNILVDQARNNDFSSFSNIMTKIKNRKADPAYEVYLSLYQSITGEEENKKIFKHLSKDFFDLIVVDECHRGSAKEDSSWREILEYFSSATQLGLTATPKETKYTSNINYFGKPIYTYSLKQGIADGFLSPYKVIRVNLDIDQGFTPEVGQTDDEGKELPEVEYKQSDMDKKIIIPERTKVVAKKTTKFLESTNKFSKTIVFCDTVNHAERMRITLVNQNTKEVKKNSKYIMRVTGDEKKGKDELENFINPEKRYPVIVTTSRLLTTGVDAKTCKLIVLDKTINSMIEFKQIIGRGTRIDEEHDKLFFTIIDFKGATKLFSDPEFDGEPVDIYEPSLTDPIIPDQEEDKQDDVTKDETNKVKDPQEIYTVSGQPVQIVGENIQYLGMDGKLITESFIQHNKRTLLKKYPTIANFLEAWHHPDNKKHDILRDLKQEGFIIPPLEKRKENIDIYDLICYFGFGQKITLKEERIRKVKKSDVFNKLDRSCQEIISALLEKYRDNGIDSLENVDNLKTPNMHSFGTPVEIINKFKGLEKYSKIINSIIKEIY